jgi:hypothetical protein
MRDLTQGMLAVHQFQDKPVHAAVRAQFWDMAGSHLLQSARRQGNAVKSGLPEVGFEAAIRILDAGIPAPDIIISHQVGRQRNCNPVRHRQVHRFAPGEETLRIDNDGRTRGHGKTHSRSQITIKPDHQTMAASPPGHLQSKFPHGGGVQAAAHGHPHLAGAQPVRHSLVIGDKDRVDIILTNPPFGGEEERGILGNFPDDKQTAETALLFLQLIMRKLKRPPKPGRAGVVVPNGVLFGDGVCARIKAELLKNFNLHTIVRLPNGVFAPYASIPTNLLFFDRSGPTKEIWYYEQPLPEGRKNYTKTKPLQYEEFADCLAWWGNRVENERAWRVQVENVLKCNGNGMLLSVNLDIKNPSAGEDFGHLPPEQLADDILKKEQRIAAIIAEIKSFLERKL